MLTINIKIDKDYLYIDPLKLNRKGMFLNYDLNYIQDFQNKKFTSMIKNIQVCYMDTVEKTVDFSYKDSIIPLILKLSKIVITENSIICSDCHNRKIEFPNTSDLLEIFKKDTIEFEYKTNKIHVDYFGIVYSN